MLPNISSLNRARLLAFCGLWFGCASTSLGTEVQGFTQPYQDIDVATAEMGIVEEIAVKEGDRVKENQILVRMDAAVLEVNLQIAESVKESKGRLESAKQELELQTKMVAKLEQLYARQHASLQELERAQTQMRIAKSHLQSVQEEIQVKTLEYNRARLQVERRQLRSPIDGMVTRILRDRGESVLLSDPVILKVVQLDPLLVVFLVPADRARELKSESAVQVRFVDRSKAAEAIVEFVSPTTDPQSGLTRVRVRIPNPKERLPCGATCYLLLSDKPPSRLVSSNR